jgi:uncharacterized protein YdaU (DUF1376 family)
VARRVGDEVECVNYYERHIGDYLKDTAHLSLLEHGVYGRLLDVYYTREGSIPVAEVARLIGAKSKDERAALGVVLAEFFKVDGGMLKQSRCDLEISRFQDKQRKAKASAEARWSHTERNANASPNAMRTHSEGNAPSNQTPVTNNPPLPSAVAPPKPPRASRKCPEGFAVTEPMVDWLASNAPGVPWQAEHAKFTDHTFRTAISDWPAAWRNWMRKAEEYRSAKPHTAEPAWRTEQRERNEAFLGPAAARRSATVIDMEASDAAPRLVG